MGDAFPKKSLVWSGAILGGIVNATVTARTPSFAYAQHWTGNDYGLNGGDGREGFIGFGAGPISGEGKLVGVFFSAHSPRSIFRSGGKDDLEDVFRGCPDFQLGLAEKLIHPALEFPFQGKDVSCVTAAFWDEHEYLTAADTWDVVLANGADLIENELIEDRKVALTAWQKDYGMSAEQVAFAQSVFERKIARPAARIELNRSEVEWLESTFEDPRQKYLEVGEAMLKSKGDKEAIDLKWLDSLDPATEFRNAMKLCREKFAAIGILVPESKF